MPACPTSASAIKRWTFAGYGREPPEFFDDGELSQQLAVCLLGGAGACDDAVLLMLVRAQVRIIRHAQGVAASP